MPRVLVHALSTWSRDGHIALTAFVDIARGCGCPVVLLAEQEKSGWDAARYEAYLLACHAISTGPSRAESPVGVCWMGRVRLVPGLELTHEGRRVPCYGLRHLPRRPSHIERLASDVRDQGAVMLPPYSGRRRSPYVVITEGDDVLADLEQGRYEVDPARQAWPLDGWRERLTRDSAYARARGDAGTATSMGANVDADDDVVVAGAAVQEDPVPCATRRGLGHLATVTPMVSVILPIRNEQAYVARALRSVLEQDYPADRLEILVADGRSTDRTRAIVRAVEARARKRVTLIDNAGQIVPTGLNALLAVATGDVIVRVDGHCEIPSDFVRRAVAHLTLDDVDCVGGMLETVGETRMARVIATAMSVPFGVGGSAFRAGAALSTLTDTVAFPAFTRQALLRTGLFDEELVRNQDDEYSYRLRRLGGRVLLATDIHARYYSRGTLRSLWRQCFQYGYWKVRVLQRHPRQMRARQFVPALFVGSLIVSLALAAFTPATWPLAALVVGSYLAATGVASWRAARAQDWTSLAWLPPAFATMHLAYGGGFLVGLVAFWRRWWRVGQAAPRKDWRVA